MELQHIERHRGQHAFDFSLLLVEEQTDAQHTGRHLRRQAGRYLRADAPRAVRKHETDGVCAKADRGLYIFLTCQATDFNQRCVHFLAAGYGKASTVSGNPYLPS